MKWTGRTLEWILDHGLQTDENGILQIPKSKWNKLGYKDRSLRNPKVKTLCVPADDGMNLIFEGTHFEIIGG